MARRPNLARPLTQSNRHDIGWRQMHPIKDKPSFFLNDGFPKGVSRGAANYLHPRVNVQARVAARGHPTTTCARRAADAPIRSGTDFARADDGRCDRTGSITDSAAHRLPHDFGECPTHRKDRRGCQLRGHDLPSRLASPFPCLGHHNRRNRS